MARNLKDWLKAYVDYASFSEAPKRMHFWSGVSAIAGALRRKVWIDQSYFKWFCNQYIVFVAPPGVVSKSTTVSIAMDILRKVPNIKFGPDAVTWPALVQAFADSTESFLLDGEWHQQSALTLESSELGNLVDPSDRNMIDLLVTLWDSKQGQFKKVTKGSGVDSVMNPWINVIACTTPAWIAGNVPEYIIGGGFTSRCLFVYTEAKEKLVPYPSLAVPPNLQSDRAILVQDLEAISQLCGPYALTPEAIDYGKKWYAEHHKRQPDALSEDRFAGYLARKQTHIHKVAMIMAASCRDSLEIFPEDLVLAETMITDLEQDMPKVFAKIGRSEESIQAERFVKYVAQRSPVPYDEAYRFIHDAFPKFRDFETMLKGAIESRLVEMKINGTTVLLLKGTDIKV